MRVAGPTMSIQASELRQSFGGKVVLHGGDLAMPEGMVLAPLARVSSSSRTSPARFRVTAN